MNTSKINTDKQQQQMPVWKKIIKYGLIGLLVFLASLVLIVILGLAIAIPKLPDVNELQDYQPKLPLRIYSSDGTLIGEFGQERRRLVRVQNIPNKLKYAVIAAEDARFFSHPGVDIVGLTRAGIANLTDFKSQGASTITMQVARNVYLTSEKTLARKLYEVLLTFKLERALSKDQILEIYLNQIFLGNRSYGFASAAANYFGKTLQELTIAEAALLAGLPKAPTAYNPLRNLPRAKVRQEYVIQRMLDNNFITKEEAQEAIHQELVFKQLEVKELDHNADYATEMVRRLIVQRYGEAAYTMGLHVYTSIDLEKQEAAYRAIRRALYAFDKKTSYRGPERFINIPEDEKEARDVIALAFNESPDSDELRTAVVWEADNNKIIAEISSGEKITITGIGLQRVRGALTASKSSKLRIKPGAVIRVIEQGGVWMVSQVPLVQGALVALKPDTGAILAVMGGFDYSLGQFNRATQAWRQPGSSFKPFIYSAALEHGISPATRINDSPIKIRGGRADGKDWVPKNSDGRYEGYISVRRALAKSKNMVAIKLMQHVGIEQTQQWITRFGFGLDKHPPYLTIALGAGAATPLQMAAAYGVFANGGYAVQPWVIEKIVDYRGRLLSTVQIQPNDESKRVIPARNAFIMNSIMNDVTRYGTAARAQSALGRTDVYGKTGTTNAAVDAWFVGFHPTISAAVWIGYDNPVSLGDRESGGGLGLPIWIEFMRTALRNQPVVTYEAPKEGLMQLGDWVYTENIEVTVPGIGASNPRPVVRPSANPQPRENNQEQINEIDPTTQNGGSDLANPVPAQGDNKQEKKEVLELFTEPVRGQ